MGSLIPRCLLLAPVLLASAFATADQFKCYTLFDTETFKVRADTRGWIEMEGQPRQDVVTFVDSNDDQIWVFGPREAFTIRPDGTGQLVKILSDAQVEKSPAYYCKRVKS